MMHWQRLDRDTTIKTIESVRSASDPGLFAPATSEVQKAHLSFYEGVALYKLTNFASLPSFTFEYLGYNGFFHYLDGTEQPVYGINDRGFLRLDERSVVDYLDFFLSHVAQDDDETVLIRNIHDMPLLDSMDSASIDAITGGHTAEKVSYDAGFDRYTVEADLYSEGLLMRAFVDIDRNGRVSIGDRRMIVNAMARGFSSEFMV